jgi:hypothetical protein
MRLIALLLSLCLAMPAAAQPPAPTLSIALGETVTVRIGEDGRFTELSRSRGDAVGERAADTVRFTFSEMGGQKMLHTENGYGRAFSFRARMFVGRRSANTSICTVLPRIAGIESWGDPIDRLELREPRLLEEGAGISCQ